MRRNRQEGRYDCNDRRFNDPAFLLPDVISLGDRGGGSMVDPGRRAADMAAIDNKVEQLDKPSQESAGSAQESKAVNYEELYRAAAESITELTAERDSLKTENDQLRAARDQAITDGQKAREMNYTLSRQLDISAQQAKQPEDILAEMFLKKGE